MSESAGERAERHHHELLRQLDSQHNEAGLLAQRHHDERRNWYLDEKARLDGGEEAKTKSWRLFLALAVIRNTIESGILATLIYMIVHYN